MSISSTDKIRTAFTRLNPWSLSVSRMTPRSHPASSTSPLASEGQAPDYPRWCISLGLSTFVHLLVIVILAQFMMATPPDNSLSRLDTSWEEADADAPTEITEIEIEPTLDVEQDSPAPTLVQPQMATIDVPTPLPTDIVSPLDDSWEADLANMDLSADIGALSRGNGDSGSGSQGFFNSDVSGKDIVYVVDASQSMNHPYPGREKTRFGRVKIEMIRAIRSMSPEQRFFIVFFNTEAIPMPGRGMQPAGEKNSDEALIWMAKHKAEGETDPSAAIELALSLQPDVIHFLTDGKIDPRLIEVVRILNQGRVNINTYCISNRDGEDVVLKLARQNGGDYKFVP